MSNIYNVPFASTGITGGKNAIQIYPGDIDTSTSLTLPGSGKTDYGQFFDANILQMLENFSGPVSPGNPTTGQLWYNTTDFRLRYYVGNSTSIDNLDIDNPGWLTIQNISGTASTTPFCGETYYNILTNQFLIYNCSTHSWQEVSLMSASEAAYVHKIGDTMTGHLVLSGVAVLDYHPIPKIQFDQGIAELTNIANGAFPLGGIIMWSGTLASVPVHWQLCDGTSGTPDLRNRFVVGAGGAYGVGATGGTTSTTLSLSTDPHTLTLDEIPSHSHTLTATHWGGFFQWYPGDSGTGSQDQVITTNAAGGGASHSHTMGSASIPTIPPYYALAYIMKIS